MLKYCRKIVGKWLENCRKMVKRFKGISAMRGEGEGESESWCINAKILSENCRKMVKRFKGILAMRGEGEGWCILWGYICLCAWI